MLTLLGLSLASPHGFQSGSSPAHGYSSMASASFVVNDSTHDPKLIHNTVINNTINQCEVISPRFDNMTSPSWLTSLPHELQAELVLYQHDFARPNMPNVLLATPGDPSTTGASTSSLYLVEGDSATANMATTNETIIPGFREPVPNFKSYELITHEHLEHPQFGSEYTYWNAFSAVFDECKNYFSQQNDMPPPKYCRRRKKKKKKEKTNKSPSPTHTSRTRGRRELNVPNANNTVRQARDYVHEARTRAEMGVSEFLMRSLILVTSLLAFTNFGLTYWVARPEIIISTVIAYVAALYTSLFLPYLAAIFFAFVLSVPVLASVVVYGVAWILRYTFSVCTFRRTRDGVFVLNRVGWALWLSIATGRLIAEEPSWLTSWSVPEWQWHIDYHFNAITVAAAALAAALAASRAGYCNDRRLPGQANIFTWLKKRVQLLCILFVAFLFDLVATTLKVTLKIVISVVMWMCNSHNDNRIAWLLVFMALVHEAMATADGSTTSYSGRSKPPLFSGERVEFTKWLILFTIWLALHAAECTDLLEGLDAEPAIPGLADVDATIESIAEATELHVKWAKRNRQLFGALGTAMPEWLATSLYTSTRNDGIGALAYLKQHFDAVAGNGNDRAAGMQRLQSSYIDTRNDLSENDVRHQYDNMMIAVNDVVTAGGQRPDDLLLIAMFENALPISYSVIKQMTRRLGHATFLSYYNDLLQQTRAELASRAPSIHAFSAGAPPQNQPTDIDDTVRALAAMGLQRIAPPPSQGRGGRAGRGGRGAPARGGRGARGAPGAGWSTQPGQPPQHPANPCLRCGGDDGHNRANCSEPKTTCRFCGVGDHLGAYCPKNPTAGARRRALGQGARAIVDRESGGPTATNSSATALDASVAPPNDVSFTETQAYAAASAAAAAQTDGTASANAYAATLKIMGFGCCASVTALSSSLTSATHALAATIAAAASQPPPLSTLVTAMVDTMATYFVVNNADYIVNITNNNPGFSVLTAAGSQQIIAVGDAHVWIPDSSGDWKCYEVPNVLLLPACSSVLYSVRVMRDLFGFKHDFDSKQGVIDMPNRKHSLPIVDNGSAFAIPISFSTVAQSLSLLVRSSVGRPAALLASIGSAFPADTMGTPQSLLYQRLGFPYAQAWRYVGASTAGHNLPPNVVMSTTLPVKEAVMRGRARALPFLSKHPTDRTPPPPGAVIYMDFAGPLLPSFPNGFTTYCGAVCAGSIYGRVVAAHTMTKEIASSTLQLFMADITAKMKSPLPLKPHVVNCDNGSAFISQHFREFLADRQIQLRFSPPYTPQLNSQIEAMWGTTFGTARVLLAASSLPPSMHPFAMQCARWIENRLPKPSRGNQSPVYMLSKGLPDLSHLYTFGSLCLVTLPTPLRSGDKHFMDRGAPGIYLGPSEEGQCHVVYVFALRRVLPVAKIRVWEDEFPGLRGDKYVWFPDVPVAGPEGPVVNVVDNNKTSSLYGPPQSQSINNNSPPFVPQSPVAPQSQPRVAHPSSPHPSSPSSPSPPSFSNNAPISPATIPSGSATATATTQRLNFNTKSSYPKGDSGSASDPSSRAFARTIPTRHSRNSNPTYASAAGQAAINIAIVAFGCFLAMDAHSRSAPGTPVDAPSVTPLAFASHTLSLDAAFNSFDANEPTDEALVHACEVASFIYSVSMVSTADLGEIPIPKGFKQAMSGPWASYWLDAITKELAGLVALRTWDIIPCAEMPSGANLMHCHYVFTIKRLRDATVEKFKARLVADGNTQKFGVDFDRIFSTVVKTSTIRLVLIVAAARDYNLTQIDIRQAYLQAELTEDLYMRVPPGIPAFDKNGRPLACKLNRTLYGLKQAGREWGILFSAFLVSWGFARSTIDTCLFIYAKDGLILWMLVYVDDCLIVDNDGSLRSRFVTDLGKRFPVDDRGNLEWLLGVAITRERTDGSLSLSQELYIKDLVSKYASHVSAGHTRKYDTPMEEGLRLSADDCPAVGSEAADQMAPKKVVYMALVGAFLWLANMTRHEIAHVTSQLARFISNPGATHFNAAMRVLTYLDGTRSRKLKYTPNASLPLHVLVDSSWETKFSCSGAYFFFMGCPFHWFSKMQRSVTLSSAESEFFGCMLALKDTLWIRQVQLDLDLLQPGPSMMWCDSKSAVAMAFDPVAFKNTKHILRAAEFLKHHTLCGSITILHAKGVIMIADILTKGQARPIFLQLLKLLDDYAKNSILELTT